jgi:CxxC motif-containing protein (DUF1111 family)
MQLNKHTLHLIGAIASGVLLSLAIAVPAQQAPRPAPPPPRPMPAATNATPFGGPLLGLTALELAAFEDGFDEFTNVETPEGGKLGPLFNGKSCAECHTAGGIGGGSTITVTRFGRTEQGHFDALDALGGSLLQRFATDPALQERVPAEANVVAQRQSTPLFGLGLIEAITDATIAQNAREPKPDGVRGKAAMVFDPATNHMRVGRFGWKSQIANLTTFAGDAYSNEMGVTNRFFPLENAPNGNRALLLKFQPNPAVEDQIDPATGKSDIDLAADFMRLLAPPTPLPATFSSRKGETVFAQTGCASCHKPSMTTGPSPIAALNRVPVNLYSDLLLHDMGALGDGIAQGDAGMREMRTAPLWGLNVRTRFLHDGRAATLDDAVRGHAGEATVSRDRYQRLPAVQRQQLLDFLGTL